MSTFRCPSGRPKVEVSASCSIEAQAASIRAHGNPGTGEARWFVSGWDRLRPRSFLCRGRETLKCAARKLRQRSPMLACSASARSLSASEQRQLDADAEHGPGVQ
jgi:hypothetical protein